MFNMSHESGVLLQQSILFDKHDEGKESGSIY